MLSYSSPLATVRRLSQCTSAGSLPGKWSTKHEEEEEEEEEEEAEACGDDGGGLSSLQGTGCSLQTSCCCRAAAALERDLQRAACLMRLQTTPSGGCRSTRASLD